MTGNKATYLTVILLLIFACCNSTTVWQQNASIPSAEWNMNDTLKFDMPVADTSLRYALCINVRNRIDYDYQNLYLFIETRAPYGGVTTDTLNCMLAYDSGEWTGSGGIFSKYRENIFLYRNNIRFIATGNYSVTIRHGMRRENLNGVAALCLILKQHNNNNIQ
ncbi:MAG: gliding motility lipoprotein GldH [Prevotellaceae bacterium]|nr:gliding motility lipoprotein GldH [Prevotellaceae bacterium]